ncbi:hypothetical protein W03_00210 [Nitrosomonas sp. PY1]|uniref:hypothetical protein n=1 Tax=Nitrosomonas sp. PY1 TaxID=1803906 RepID=UPI001FC7BCCA|nr:hypothetical protein [Nitrosomonas sp. PY1]GKS68017.1 hypothetical protein W03_00210 [Nitrosomonas sp. PY1]
MMMRKYIITVLIAIYAIPALASNTGASVSIGQSGVYGQIHLNNQYPNPQLIYSNPVTAIHSAGVPQQPVYLHVPPGHAKKWNKHCHRYNACGQPAYFVQEKWYNDVYRLHSHNQNSHSDRRTTVANRNGHRKPSNIATNSRQGNQKHLGQANNKQHKKREQKQLHQKNPNKGGRKDR